MRFKCVEDAEARIRRMCRLQTMDAAELHVLLSGDQTEAAPWIEAAARFGLAAAQLRYAQMRLDGNGVAKDEAEAFSWFMKAAAKGSAEALNMVGRCYENAWGVAEDLGQAARYYRASAELAHDWGEYNLANLLFDGRGVAQDLAEAAQWYGRAAKQGHARAMNLLARCYEEGWGVPRDATLAFQWYRRAAQGGYFRAEFNYGTVLAAGGHVDEALYWLEKACRAATPKSLAAMTEILARQSDRRLLDLARRFVQEIGGPLDREGRAAA